MTVAHYILDALKSINIDTIFGVPGGGILPFIHAMEDLDFNFVVTQSEQGAVHAADGYFRATNKIGVCMATCGPGSTNLITGLTTANRDNSNILAIVGGISKYRIGTGSFQEFNICGAITDSVGIGISINNKQEINDILTTIFDSLNNNHNKSALLEVPQDIALETIHYEKRFQINISRKADNNHIDGNRNIAAKIIKDSFCPVIIAGGACTNKKILSHIDSFSIKYNIPVVVTMRGLSNQWTRFYGFCGEWGHLHALNMINNSDCIIALGVKFNHVLGNSFKNQHQRQRIIHIDHSENNLKLVKSAPPPKIQICDDIVSFLNYIDTYEPYKNDFFDLINHNTEEKTEIDIFFQQLASIMGKNATVFADVGQHLVWAARNLFYNKISPKSIIFSGSYGCVGFGLPASIGAAISGLKDIWLIIGDGSIMMYLSELETIKRYKLNINILLLDNRSLGFVYQFQKRYYNSNFGTCYNDNISFKTIFESFNINYSVIEHTNDIYSKLSHNHTNVFHKRIRPDDEPIYRLSY